MDKWDWVCRMLLSSWGERGRQEGLPGEHLRVLVHTPVSSAACLAWARIWSRSCPPCAVFSALISSSSRKLKSSSGATLKRTTLWPILSGLQISQACERANQPCTLAPSETATGSRRRILLRIQVQPSPICPGTVAIIPTVTGNCSAAYILLYAETPRQREHRIPKQIKEWGRKSWMSFT